MDWTIKQGATLPAFTDTLVDAAGAAVNLTTATSVRFIMRSLSSTSPKVNAVATIVSAVAGTVSYTPSSTDTDTAGVFAAYWLVTWNSGATQVFPLVGYRELLVEESLTGSTARIVSLGETRDYLNWTDTDSSRDAELIRFIDTATALVEEIVGPVVSRTVEEWHPGGTSVIALRTPNSLSVTSLVEYQGSTPVTLTEVALPENATATSFTRVADVITRRGVGGWQYPFPLGSSAVHITYVAGMSPIPANIKTAALELVRHLYQQTQQPGRPRFSGSDVPPDEAGSGAAFAVPHRVAELLQPKNKIRGFA